MAEPAPVDQTSVVTFRDNRDISERDATLQARLRIVGVILLVAGLAFSAIVYRMAPPDSDSILYETKKDDLQMEYLAGKANMLASDVREWFAGLWHGRNLARSIAVFAVGSSLVCFFVAHRLNYSPIRGRVGDGPEE